ncbi:MAG: hypothetical protein J6P07_07025 [Spirochaetaceae bacterium]|nr:hypothetical protein [Spirochaetaceae bacterium]MBO7735839.1 hypothetical protein [Methanobrevibacter sp.]
MIAEEATKSIEQAVCHELRNIVKKYGPTYASEHEGYAVLMEECQEAAESDKDMQEHLEKLWKSIRENQISKFELSQIYNYAKGLAEEAVQVAAVCERFIETIQLAKKKEQAPTYREDKTIL